MSIMALTTVLDFCGHKTLGWLHLYKSDPEFNNTYQMLLEGKQILDFHLEGALLFYLRHLYVPSSKRAKMIWEAHYSWVVVHFRVYKIVVVQ